MRALCLLLLITLAYAVEVLPQQQGGSLGGLGGDGGDGDDPRKPPHPLKSTHEQDSSYDGLVEELVEEATNGENGIFVIADESEGKSESHFFIMPSKLKMESTGTQGTKELDVRTKLQADLTSGTIQLVRNNLFRKKGKSSTIGSVKTLGGISHVHAICRRKGSTVVLSGKPGINGRHRVQGYDGCHLTIQSEERGSTRPLTSLDRGAIVTEINQQGEKISRGIKRKNTHEAHVAEQTRHQIFFAEQLVDMLREADERMRNAQQDDEGPPKKRLKKNPEQDK